MFMEYREVGKTGLQASVVGLGCEHLDLKPYEVVAETIDAALEQGVNILDVFMPGEEVRRNIGKALAGRRDKVLLQGHIGSTDIGQQYDISRDPATCQRYFEDLLRFLGTDYIDFGMLFMIDTEAAFQKVFDTEIVRYAQRLKEQGTIRAIGASSHNPAIARKMVETGVLDMLMFSINPAFDMMPASEYVLDTFDDRFSGWQLGGVDPERAALYQLCEQRGVGITVMKTLGAGRLLNAGLSPFAQPLSVAQCIHYALTRPAVVSTLVGCCSREQVLDTVRYLDMSDEERDYSQAVAHRGTGEMACVYCNHCQPCPAEIDIAAATKYLDIAALDEHNIPDSVRSHYGELEHGAGECIRCGSCEERCPFGVPAMHNMERAAALFGR